MAESAITDEILEKEGESPVETVENDQSGMETSQENSGVNPATEESKSSQSSEGFEGFDAEFIEPVGLLDNEDDTVLSALKCSTKLIKTEPPALEEGVRRSGRTRVENRRFSEAFFISPLRRSSPKKSVTEVKLEPATTPVVSTPSSPEKPVVAEISTEQPSSDTSGLSVSLNEPVRRKRGRPKKCSTSDAESTDDEKLADVKRKLMSPPQNPPATRRGRPKKVPTVTAKLSSLTEVKVKFVKKSQTSVETAEVPTADHSTTATEETEDQQQINAGAELDQKNLLLVTNLVSAPVEAKEEMSVTEEDNKDIPSYEEEDQCVTVKECITAVDPLTEADIHRWTKSDDHYEIPFDREPLLKLKISVAEGAVSALPVSRSRTGLKVKGAKPKSVKFAEMNSRSSLKTPTTSYANESSDATEMVRRLNVRRSFLEALSARAKECDDLLLADSEVKKVAVNLEAELHKLHGGTGSKYRDQFKLIQGHLKNAHNKGLYQKLLMGELTPGKLVLLSPDDLQSKKFFSGHLTSNSALTKTGWPSTSGSHKGFPKAATSGTSAHGGILDALMTDTTANHKGHLYDLNCRICTKKESEPVEEKPTGRVATPTGTKVSGYIERGGVLDPVFTVAMPRAADPLQLEELRAEDTASPSSSSSSTGLDGKPTKVDSLADKWKAKQTDQWNGKIIMPDMFKFHTALLPVTGPKLGSAELPAQMEIVGRIDPVEVWKYLINMKKVGVKLFSVVRLAEPFADEDKQQYADLFENMVQKQRYCVIQFSSPVQRNIKDFYVMPLSATDEIPPGMLPIDGPGIPANRKNILLGLVVRHKLPTPPPQPKKPPPVVSQPVSAAVRQVPIISQPAPLVPAAVVGTAPVAPVYAANVASAGLGETQIRHLIQMVKTSPNPDTTFQHLLQCYGSAMSETDKQFMLKELQEGSNSQLSSSAVMPTGTPSMLPAGVIPPDFAAMMAQMPQLMNPSAAAGSPEFAALQQQFIGLMQMMMSTMMNVSAAAAPMAATTAPITVPTPNTTTNDSDSSRDSGGKKSRPRRMSHTSTSSSCESEVESGEDSDSHRQRVQSRKQLRRRHRHSSTDKRRESTKESGDGDRHITWGSGSLDKKFGKKYDDPDNLGSAGGHRNRPVDSKRPRVDYGDAMSDDKPPLNRQFGTAD